MSEEIEIIGTETIGKVGKTQTILHLSNGWWIQDSSVGKNRENRFILYKPGVGNNKNHGTQMGSGNNLKKLLRRANELQRQQDK